MSANFSKHQRRWGSDTVPGKPFSSTVSSPAFSVATSSEEEFVEVTLDFQDDDTVILRSVEPAPLALGAASDADAAETPDCRAPTPGSASASSRSPSMGRSSSHRLRQFSQELKAEAVAKAKQLSHDLRAELRRFSWSHGSRAGACGASVGAGSAGAVAALDSALAARALRKQRAQLDRTRSGTQKALRGLRFMSGGGKTNGVDAWNEVQASFNRLAKGGYLSRSDFAQCIGRNPSLNFTRNEEPRWKELNTPSCNTSAGYEIIT